MEMAADSTTVQGQIIIIREAKVEAVTVLQELEEQAEALVAPHLDSVVEDCTAAAMAEDQLMPKMELPIQVAVAQYPEVTHKVETVDLVW
jgi:hypothetical protein